MKATTYILFLTTFINLAYSQPYKSVFGKDSTEWSVMGHNADNGWYTSGIFKCYNDTSDSIRYVYEYAHVNSHYYTNAGFLREDTLTGKLWSGDILIMDLSLNKNDTFYLKKTINWIDTFIVDTVFLLNGRKNILFKQSVWPYVPPFSEDSLMFIEGVGPNNIFSIPNGSLLNCYHRDDSLFYQNSHFSFYYNDCYLTIGIEENYTEYNLYPNPTNNIIIFKTINPEQDNLITIYNSLGQPLLTSKIIEEKTTIDLSNFQPGLYVLIYSSREDRVLKTFIITN